MGLMRQCLLLLLFIGVLHGYDINHVTQDEKELEDAEDFHDENVDTAFDIISRTNMGASFKSDDIEGSQVENETEEEEEQSSGNTKTEEEKVKKGKSSHLFESDILIYDYPEGETDTSESVIGESVLKRTLRRRQEYLWIDRVIPYEFTPDVSGSEHIILEAMKSIEAVSCIKFEKRTNEDDWIKFVNKGGCYSGVGRVFWTKGSQDISLTSGCQGQVGTIEHELLHALGFWHEQSRPDRDSYIEVLWENIAEGQQHNFEKYSPDESNDFRSLYDPDSIMHYGRYAFSKNGQPTILYINDKNKDLGQRSGLSKEDQIQLNALYRCQDVGNAYTSWTEWSPCDRGGCTKIRQRFCSNHNAAKCPEAGSRGVHTETTKCTNEECHAPIDGHWGRWSTWTECSASCGKGIRNRKRQCDDPVPVDGGSQCTGDDAENKKCEIQPCGLNPDDCLFDQQSMCFWKDESASTDYIWRRITGRTPTSRTGPDHDHTTANKAEKTGHYMYTESSSPAKTGNKASLVSKSFPAIGNRCMTFFYSMYGFTMGSLRLFLVKDGSGEELLWEKNGEQGKGWIEDEVSFTSTTSYKLKFEAERGPSFKGDIGLDDIHFRDTSCSVVGEKVPQVNKNKMLPAPRKLPPHIKIPSKLVPVCDGIKASVEPLGCYAESQNYRAMGNLLDDHRQGHDGGNVINWKNYPETLSKLLCHCVKIAKKSGYSYISLQYYGLCYGGVAPNYRKYGPSNGCVDSAYQECSSINDQSICIGKDQMNYVYRIM